VYGKQNPNKQTLHHFQLIWEEITCLNKVIEFFSQTFFFFFFGKGGVGVSHKILGTCTFLSDRYFCGLRAG
jgi:hypothetical protein